MRILAVVFLVALIGLLIAVGMGMTELRTAGTAVLFMFLGLCVYMALSWSKRSSENDPESPIVVAMRPDEMQASVLVDQLQSHDINAVAVGTFTSGFQVEIASMVKIVVPRRQFDSAKEILAQSEAEAS